MAYIYLFNLYEQIDIHLAKTRKMIEDSHTSLIDIRYHEGRADILGELKCFLSKNLDQKLPKRMRKKISLKK
ncbi:MAG: hypothetical protein ABIJ59_18875 [Pseudomonadota bacterium]